MDNPAEAAAMVLELLAEGEEITNALIGAAQQASVAEHQWRTAEARGIARSDASAASDRKAEALIAYAPVHAEYIKAKAYHEALVERARWLRSAVGAAQTVLAFHRSQMEAMGLGDHVNEGRTRRN